MTSLTIQLDDRTNSRLLELSQREHKQPEAIAADAVRRRLFIDWLDDMNDTLSKRTAERGFLNEDDFLNAIS
jgi:predicted transcriptional regulator